MIMIHGSKLAWLLIQLEMILSFSIGNSYHRRTANINQENVKRNGHLSSHQGFLLALSKSLPQKMVGLHHHASFPTSIEPKEESTPVPRKLEQLTSQELINFLRNLKQEIRFNTFSHSIEMDGKVIKNIEIFYLTLAELGYKVPKEMAVDCLLKVAHENEYDPVKLYLDHCYNEIQPAYIESLASTYLRPQDQKLTEPTIYDTMLKLTLINAVRRVYMPGCKHDTATVLTGFTGNKKIIILANTIRPLLFRCPR